MSNRIQKINELIKRELGEIILKEMNFSRNVLVTIIKTETSVDLSLTKVYISVIPWEKTDEIIKNLKGNIYELQQMLNKRLNMHPIPKIKFLKDYKTGKIGKVEEILDKIRVEKQHKI